MTDDAKMNYKTADNIFYSVVGKHGGETVEEIISRKQKEVELCGYSLWSAHIDQKSVEQVWALSKDDEVYVLCKINKDAKDPVRQGDSPYYATTQFGPKGEEDIPKDIKTSFTEGKKYQAYVVEEYEMLDASIEFDFGKYETMLANGNFASFAERFKFSKFQNTYGKKNVTIDAECSKTIGLIMKLKYPFVVELK